MPSTKVTEDNDPQCGKPITTWTIPNGYKFKKFTTPVVSTVHTSEGSPTIVP